MSCRVRIARESNPNANHLSEYVVGFDGRFIGNLQVGGSVYAQADPGFHSVTFSIAAHPSRRLSVYVPEDVREITFFTRFNPLNNEVTLDQNREQPQARPAPQAAERAAPAPSERRREDEAPVRRREAAPAKSHTLGAVSLALGAAGLFNAFYFQNYIVAIAGLAFGLVTLLASRSQRMVLGVIGIFLAAVAVAVATLLQTGLAAQMGVTVPESGQQSVTEAADRMKELSDGQNTVIYDGEELKVTFRRIYEVGFAEGECYLQLKIENKFGQNAMLRLDKLTINGESATATGGMSGILRPGEIVTNPYVISFRETEVKSLQDVNTLSFELVLTDSQDLSKELFRTPRIDLAFSN